MNSGMPPQIGPYTIEREIGRGGMGVVYLARDTKLDRDVAIKALPPELADDASRLARFEREAKTLAQLNHANVAGIHGIEEQDGQKFLALEYVEGETLAERLTRGALPIDEALQVAIEIAAGVEAAHEAGIVHRDLKPDNVKLTPEGKVKVLDFGLARTADPDSSTIQAGVATVTPTTPGSHTIPGTVLGTAPYMSPEQARGRRVDKRADIWAFACLLYEMLTAEPLFGRETPSDSIAAILEREPDLSRLPARTPRRIVDLMSRCLEKEARRRLRDIGDARLELEDALAGRDWMTRGPEAAPSTSAPRRTVGAVALVVLGAVLGGVGVTLLGPSLLGRDVPPAAGPALRLELPLVVDGEHVAVDDMAIAPDGSVIAITPIGDGPILVRDADSFELRALEGTEGAEWPMFSPDGRWIAFYQRDQLLRIPREGGLALAIADAQGFV
ncbi:MAG: protein kinase domain-containing protein, partial [Planctomycetota bacterium]